MDNSPLIIGGTGGSGTRVIMRIVQSAGVDMGSRLNETDDAVAFFAFHNFWVNQAFFGLDRKLPPPERRAMDRQFRECLHIHCEKMQESEQWGWKTPRSLLLLPFLHRHFPALRFIHVIRDGRDMALSKNQNQLRDHGAAILGRQIDVSNPLDSFAFWLKTNNAAADYGERILRRQYLRLRFEDVFTNTTEICERLWEFIGLKGDLSLAGIVPPKTIGRWKDAPPEIKQAFNELGEESLRRFGYTVE